MHERFGLNTEGVCDTIDVVKVADHLGGIVDGAIVHTMCPEYIEVGRAHLLGRARQLIRIFAQGAIKG
ncbi:MAG: hypothetical protein ACK5XN_24145 [Bacteroidota bacterium]|jgi:hypothetical protein